MSQEKRKSTYVWQSLSGEQPPLTAYVYAVLAQRNPRKKKKSQACSNLFYCSHSYFAFTIIHKNAHGKILMYSQCIHYMQVSCRIRSAGDQKSAVLKKPHHFSGYLFLCLTLEKCTWLLSLPLIAFALFHTPMGELGAMTVSKRPVSLSVSGVKLVLLAVSLKL